MESPVFYFINPEGSPEARDRLARTTIETLPLYASEHPLEITRWRAQRARLGLQEALAGNLTLAQVQQIGFSGEVALEFGWGEERSTFHAQVVHLDRERLEIPSTFSWSALRWSLSAAQAGATLREAEAFRRKGPVTESLMQGLEDLEFAGPSLLRVTPEQGDDIILDAPQGGHAEMRGRSTLLRLSGEINLRQGRLRGTLHNTHLVLGPAGIEWLEAESPAFDLVDDQEETLRIVGKRLRITVPEMTIEGDPVHLTSRHWFSQTSSIRRDMTTGRLRLKEPHIQPLTPTLSPLRPSGSGAQAQRERE